MGNATLMQYYLDANQRSRRQPESLGVGPALNRRGTLGHKIKMRTYQDNE